jgi:hypothetical protein
MDWIVTLLSLLVIFALLVQIPWPVWIIILLGILIKGAIEN